MRAKPLVRLPWITLAVALGLGLTAAQPAWGFRVVCYNLLNYSGGTDRLEYFRTVTDSLDADIVVVQEMTSQTGVNAFLNNVLNYNSPGAYKAMPFVNGPDTDNACFYKSALLDSISHQQINTAIRQTSEYVFRPDGYSSSAAEFRLLSTHLKAGNTSEDEADRLVQANVIRNYLNGLPSGSHFMVMGDFNVYTSTDLGYQRLVRSETDNDGRTKDPINRPGAWHDNYTFAGIHTQSTRTTDFGGGSTGGMDDRFDQILISYALDDGDGLSYVASSYFAFGNDGYHLNAAINAMPNFIVSQAVADALHYASDHTPVVAGFQLPARLDATDVLAFGSWIVGGAAQRTLTVANDAPAPADELSYTLTAPAGFTAPGGTFTANAGTGSDHSIGMSTAAAGVLSGTLVVNSNDLDYPAWNVSLSGTVLNHAVPSLDALVAVLVDTIDFGAHAPDEFSEQPFSVHNLGFTSLQALLDVYDATIEGGGGLFSFTGGVIPQEIGAAPAGYSIGFDADMAQQDSLYAAVLTLETRDDTDVQGGTTLSDLVIHLSACVTSGSGVPETPTALALGPARPNPFTEGTVLSLALPDAANVVVSIHDLTGRLVRTLVSQTLGAGVHEIAWDGRDGRGERAASGVYFFRAEVGERREVRKLVLMK